MAYVFLFERLIVQIINNHHGVHVSINVEGTMKYRVFKKSPFK